MKTPCVACRALVPDISKRFDPDLGFCCFECWSFLMYADIRLPHHGIKGVIASPVRYTQKPETP